MAAAGHLRDAALVTFLVRSDAHGISIGENKMQKPADKPSLYRRLKDAGCELDHHESDLQVRATPEALAIIKAYEDEGGFTNKRQFVSQTDGTPWIDLPFHYEPYWDQKIRPVTVSADPEAWELVGTAGDYAVWCNSGAFYNVTTSEDEAPTSNSGYNRLDALLRLKGLSETDFEPKPAGPRP